MPHPCVSRVTLAMPMQPMYGAAYANHAVQDTHAGLRPLGAPYYQENYNGQ